jgi:hypothetical protein
MDSGKGKGKASEPGEVTNPQEPAPAMITLKTFEDIEDVKERRVQLLFFIWKSVPEVNNDYRKIGPGFGDQRRLYTQFLKLCEDTKLPALFDLVSKTNKKDLGKDAGHDKNIPLHYNNGRDPKYARRWAVALATAAWLLGPDMKDIGFDVYNGKNLDMRNEFLLKDYVKNHVFADTWDMDVFNMEKCWLVGVDLARLLKDTGKSSVPFEGMEAFLVNQGDMDAKKVLTTFDGIDPILAGDKVPYQIR